MKNKRIMYICGGLLAIVIFISGYTIGSLKPISKNPETVTFTITPGTNKLEIIKNLKEANLIKSEIVMLAYVFVSPDMNLQAGTYYIDRSDSPVAIVNQIADGNTKELAQTISVKFVEGLWFTDYARIISQNFDYTYDEIISKGTDQAFIKSLIDKYWFLDEAILNKDIYYPLEGYLFPDTYEFYENTSLEAIFEKMLSEFGKKIEPYKTDIEKSEYSLHELLTIASIAEKEALPKRQSMGKDEPFDREVVSQVIYKRLKVNMTLGMDVTTYYGVQKDMSDALTAMDLATYNGYNTRHSNFLGLPVGPICNPSLESIIASMNPSNTDYTYFVADVNTGKVYFASTYNEFYAFCKQLGLR